MSDHMPTFNHSRPRRGLTSRNTIIIIIIVIIIILKVYTINWNIAIVHINQMTINQRTRYLTKEDVSSDGEEKNAYLGSGSSAGE